MLTLTGPAPAVNAAAAYIGYADKPTTASDMVFIGLGIAIGAIIGAITLHLGGTAAMCYIFDSLQANHLVNNHDRIAIMTPIFTPFLEIPGLDRYEFDVVNIEADVMDSDGRHVWQYSDEQLDKLRDPSIKLLCLVNPSNPPSYKLSKHCMDRIVEIVNLTKDDYVVIGKAVRQILDSYHEEYLAQKGTGINPPSPNAKEASPLSLFS